MNAAETPISGRWKHLRGEGREAVYRAICGRPSCPHALGELVYRSGVRGEAGSLRARLRAAEAVLGDRPRPEDAAMLAEIRRGVEWLDANSLGTTAPGWIMRAPKHNGIRGIYRGFPDSGYRISFGGKRSLGGVRVGHRQQDPAWSSMLTLPETKAVGGPRGVFGQTPCPPARVWCLCGTLNALDWPEPLQGLQAQ